MIEIKPLPRGSGFKFTDTITGGVVPKQYIQSVETGVREYPEVGAARLSGRRHRGQSVGRLLSRGRFLRHGVPDGGASIGMKEGMAQCSPVLLEPIMKVEIVTPSEATAEDHRRWCRSGAGRSSASMPGPAGRAGTWSRRPCRNPRSAT